MVPGVDNNTAVAVAADAVEAGSGHMFESVVVYHIRIPAEELWVEEEQAEEFVVEVQMEGNLQERFVANQAHQPVSIRVEAGHIALIEYNSIGSLEEPAGNNMVIVDQSGKKALVVHILVQAARPLGGTVLVGI